MKLLKKIIDWCKHNFIKTSGFTLIEAIVTVAIVGAVITPIALIFQGALVTSIETKDKMRATHLSQQYIEALKVLDFDTLKSLVIDSDGIVTSSNYTTYDLPEVLDDYLVEVDLHYASTDHDGTDAEFNLDNANFKMDTDIDSVVVDSDLYILLESSISSQSTIYSSNNPYDATPLVKEHEYSGSVNSDRNMLITLADHSNGTVGHYTITLVQDGETKTVNYVSGVFNHNIIIMCNDEISDVAMVNDTKIIVTNTTADTVNIYVYESPLDTIDPDIEVGNGSVSQIRGVAEVNPLSHRIYEIEVTIKVDTGTVDGLGDVIYEELSHVVATSFAK